MSRLRLRPGVHYAPIDGGVYVSGARAAFVMSGPAALFRVADICVPRLEDGTDVDELVAAVGTPAAAPLITHLVKTFDSRGLILHLDQLVGPEPSTEDWERFPESLAYLETHRDQPYADFGRIRSAQVLVAGPAEALGPAARGLLRAGVGRLIVATPEPERLAGLAARHPEVRVERWSEAMGLAPLLSGFRPQAAVVCTEDRVPAEALASLPAGCLAVAVRLGKDLAIVGPAAPPAADWAGIGELWARAATWCQRDGGDLLVRPSGDLLAGALAGQMAFDALAGIDPGRVHVVHGPDLSADSFTAPPLARIRYDPPTEFTNAPPPGATGRDWLNTASTEWSGLFRLAVPGDLPQMPLALTLADGRTGGFDGRVVGFGPDQDASTVEAGLGALRQHVAGLGPLAAGDDRPWAPAAGLDEADWLLDGALRLVSRIPGEESAVEWLGVDDVESRRLWRALEEYELTPVVLSQRRLPAFGWALVSVRDRRTGALLAAGWGATLAAGAVASLSAALATRQVRRCVDAGYDNSAAEPGLVGYLHRPHLEFLAATVESWLAATGQRLRGQRLSADPVAGPIGAWCGPVWLDD